MADARLDAQAFAVLRRELKGAKIGWQATSDTEHLMAQLRSTYEPQIHALSAYLFLPLSGWVGTGKGRGVTRQEFVERLHRQGGKGR